MAVRSKHATDVLAVDRVAEVGPVVTEGQD